jgi:hypothetical protein
MDGARKATRSRHSARALAQHARPAGKYLGNGTADEHSGTLMRACMDRTLRSRRALATPTHRRPVGSSPRQQSWPICPISVDQRSFAVPDRGQPFPGTPPSPTWAASSTRDQFVTRSRDDFTTNRRGNHEAFVLSVPFPVVSLVSGSTSRLAHVPARVPGKEAH